MGRHFQYVVVGTYTSQPALIPCRYEFLNLDDGWSEPARVNGRLAANKEAFPSGMPALSSYIRSKKLKFGIYGDAGSHTCAGFPGKRGQCVPVVLLSSGWVLARSSGGCWHASIH